MHKDSTKDSLRERSIKLILTLYPKFVHAWHLAHLYQLLIANFLCTKVLARNMELLCSGLAYGSS